MLACQRFALLYSATLFSVVPILLEKYLPTRFCFDASENFQIQLLGCKFDTALFITELLLSPTLVRYVTIIAECIMFAQQRLVQLESLLFRFCYSNLRYEAYC